MHRFFSNDGDTFETHATAEQAKARADSALDSFRDESTDGWCEEVTYVCWGEILQQSAQVDVVTVETADELMGERLKAEGWDYHCDYQLVDIRPAREAWAVERHVDYEFGEFGEVRDVCGSKAEALKAAAEIMAEVGTPGSWHMEERNAGSVSWEQGTNTVSIERYMVGEPKTSEHVETWLCWRELGLVEGEDTPRLLTPWSDPNKYEYPADGLFATSAEAEIWKNENAPDEDWYLVEERLTVVAHHPPVGDPSWKEASDG